MKRIFLSILLVTASVCAVLAQEVQIIDTFDELEAYAFDHDNDTTYVVNFWATWCAPCVAELPYFEALRAKYQGQKYRQILVTLDFKKQVDSRVIPFIQKESIQSEVVLLADGKANKWIDRVDPSWSGAIPITVIYRGDERQFYEKEFHDLAELETEFLKIFKP